VRDVRFLFSQNLYHPDQLFITFSLLNRKSSLVHQMKSPLENVNGYFIEGKFDNLSRPDTILASALNNFFGTLLDCGAEDDETMKWRVASAIGSSSDNVLFEILPNLHMWMINGDVATGSQYSSSNVKGRSSHRLKYLFCKLISAIACRAHPLILYLDDIQCKFDGTYFFIYFLHLHP
jgi:predicted ATPase